MAASFRIEADDKIIDNACMQLVMRPEQFDVMLLENLYGDIVSDLCAGLIGGLGLVPGANIGEKGAMFEAVHGSAPDIAGQGIANPTALLQSGILMLRHIGEREAADRTEAALLKVFAEGKVLTRDIGGTAKTAEFANEIIGRCGNKVPGFKFRVSCSGSMFRVSDLDSSRAGHVTGTETRNLKPKQYRIPPSSAM